ncbi:hypothetical protein, partial [Pseudomonas savastanoi]
MGQSARSQSTSVPTVRILQ